MAIRRFVISRYMPLRFVGYLKIRVPRVQVPPDHHRYFKPSCQAAFRLHAARRPRTPSWLSSCCSRTEVRFASLSSQSGAPGRLSLLCPSGCPDPACQRGRSRSRGHRLDLNPEKGEGASGAFGPEHGDSRAQGSACAASAQVRRLRSRPLPRREVLRGRGWIVPSKCGVSEASSPYRIE